MGVGIPLKDSKFYVAQKIDKMMDKMMADFFRQSQQPVNKIGRAHV